jgi:hypothetical protein
MNDTLKSLADQVLMERLSAGQKEKLAALVAGGTPKTEIIATVQAFEGRRGPDTLAVEAFLETVPVGESYPRFQVHGLPPAGDLVDGPQCYAECWTREQAQYMLGRALVLGWRALEIEEIVAIEEG